MNGELRRNKIDLYSSDSESKGEESALKEKALKAEVHI